MCSWSRNSEIESQLNLDHGRDYFATKLLSKRLQDGLNWTDNEGVSFYDVCDCTPVVFRWYQIVLSLLRTRFTQSNFLSVLFFAYERRAERRQLCSKLSNYCFCIFNKNNCSLSRNMISAHSVSCFL